MIKPKTIVVNKNTGFTLIELIFAATLLSVMFAIAITAFIGVLRFSIWSRTTRTNQAAAREAMDVMTRLIEANDIVAVSSNEVCLKNPLDNNSIKISIDAQVAQKQTFATNSCTGVVGETTSISNTNLKIQTLKFSKVVGAVNSDSYLTTHPDAVNKSTSVVIDMTIVNGSAISLPPLGVPQCPPAENFCDVVKFTTAVTGD